MEKIAITRCIYNDLWEEEIKDKAMMQLGAEIVKNLYAGAWYRVKLNTSEERIGDVKDFLAEMEYETIQENVIVCKPPEKLFLQPEKTIWKKLKNCWRYLQDKTGGYIEVRKE